MENSVLWLTIWAIFSNVLINLTIVYGICYWNPKLSLDLQKQKSLFLLITITMSFNIQIDKIVYGFDLETTIPAFLEWKRLNYLAKIFFIRELSAINIAKFSISTRTDITLQTSLKQLRGITICCAFTPDCGYDKSTIILIGDVFCPNTKSSSETCLPKKTFQSLGRNDYQCLQCASVCQVGNVHFEIQTLTFFVVWLAGLHFWKKGKIISEYYWRCLLWWQVLFQQINANLLMVL